MKEVALILVLLMACTQTVIETTPTTLAVVCQERTVGEACGCRCREPAECIQGTCLLTEREINESCAFNEQCISGYCEHGWCTQRTSPIGVYDCKRVCHTTERNGCTTQCSFG